MSVTCGSRTAWRRVLPVLLALSIGVLLVACGADDRAAPPLPSSVFPSSSTSAGPPSPRDTPSASATEEPVPSSEPSQPSQPSGPSGPSQPSGPAPGGVPVLRPGETGPQVEELQRRLAAAGYWLGSPDGTYGQLTRQAVLAVQKAAGIGLDGLVGPATRAVIDRGVRPEGRSTQGLVLEVDKGRQLLMVVRDGQVETIFNTSSGTEEVYQHDGVEYLADTPPGAWHIFRQVNGVDHGSLGDLYRPKYFHTDGIAIHGYASVPARAASHGCVRVTNAAMDWLWSSDSAAIGTEVLVY
ncbi:L,D-transpeptidase family protein [Parafrankia elaeagni]|uniref:L,D-transpeptidase family protein n=1 Tax=Parafrankia elaeagni TaxID=222534 RepID=UPI0007C7297E|nr:L,D-transpeptidase family protein [Parafrankia elaeagni]